MHIIDGGEANTTAAYDPADKRLVLVTTNYGTAQRSRTTWQVRNGNGRYERPDRPLGNPDKRHR